MKNSAVIALGLALCCSAPAQAQEPVPFPDPPAADLPVGATTILSVFRAEALRSDASSLAASRLALERARDPEVRAYAQRVIANRTATTNALLPADAVPIAAGSLAAAGLPDSTDRSLAAGRVPLDPAGQSRIQRLRATRDQDAFERDYVAGQARSDSRMLALYQGFYRRGDTAEGRRFAYEALPYIETDRSRSAELNDLYGG